MGGFRRMLVGSTAIAVWLGFGLPAHAAPDAELAWEAPAGCPDRTAVRADVERLLGRELELGEGARISATGTVVVAGEIHRLRLRIGADGDASLRTLNDPSCETLAGVAALYIALAIDPGAMIDLGEPIDVGDPTSRTYEGVTARAWAEETTAATPDLDAGSPIAPAARRVRAGVRAAGGANVGMLPGVGPGLAVAAALLLRRVRLEAVGSYWFSRDARHDVEVDVGADLRMGEAALRGCPVLRARRFEFPLCAGVALGGVVARGVGVDPRRVRRSLWAAVTAGPALAWVPPMGWLALWAQVDLVVPLVRPGFSVEGLGSLYRSGPVGGQAFVGLEARIP